MRVLLGLIGLMIGLLVAAEWWLWPVRLPDTLDAAEIQFQAQGGGVADEVAEISLPPLTNFSVLTARPLFVEGRRPPPPELEPEIPEPKVEPPKQEPLQMSLSAILILGKDRIALLREARKEESNRLRQGEEFNGWRVDSIETDRVVMSRGDEKEEIMLRQFKEMPPAPPSTIPGTPGARAEDVRSKIEEARRRSEQMRRDRGQSPRDLRPGTR